MAGTLSGTIRLAGRCLATAIAVFAFGGLPAAFGAPSAAQAHAARTARARDIAATRAYIEVDYKFARAGRAKLSASLAAINALVHRTVSECPLAGEGAYVNHAANQISEEVLETVEVTAYQPDIGEIRAAAHDLRHLRWSNARLTRRVHAFVVKLENLAALAPADICVDVKAYAATSFTVAPEATVSFVKLFHAAEIESEEVPVRWLAPYEGPRETKMMRVVKRLEGDVAETEAHAVQQWMAIMRGLDLSV